MTVGIDRGRISEPAKCPRTECNSSGTMTLVHNRCLFADKQICRLQETPDSVPEGQTPHTISMCVYDDLLDTGKPGDRLEVTAIFRAVPVRINSKQRVMNSILRTYLDVVHIRKQDKKRLAIDPTIRSDNEPTVDCQEDDQVHVENNQDEQAIRELARNPNLYSVLAQSLGWF